MISDLKWKSLYEFVAKLTLEGRAVFPLRLKKQTGINYLRFDEYF